jgi:hypothetical protein
MLEEYLTEITIPFICASIYCMLLYLDTKLNNVYRTGKDYLKSFIILYALSYLAIYLYEIRFVPIVAKTTETLVSNVREEIFTGAPGF